MKYTLEELKMEDIKNDFKEFIRCWADLYIIFNQGLRSSDKYIFKNEFTFENWRKKSWFTKNYKFNCVSLQRDVHPLSASDKMNSKLDIQYLYVCKYYRGVEFDTKTLIKIVENKTKSVIFSEEFNEYK